MGGKEEKPYLEHGAFGEELNEDGATGPDVHGRGIGLGAEEDFRRAVPEGHDLVGERTDGRDEGAGEAKVGDLETACCLCLGGWVGGWRGSGTEGAINEWVVVGEWVGGGSLLLPFSETRRFCGLRSRCMMPRAWQKARPLKIWKRKDLTVALASMSGWASMYFLRSRSTNSKTKYSRPSLCTQSSSLGVERWVGG